MRGKNRAWKTAALLLAAVLVLCGCGNDIVLTSQPVRGELFAVGDAVAYVQELRVYYTNLQKEYENRFGGDIWDAEGNESLGEAVLDNAMARLSKVKALTLLADERGISLSEEENMKAGLAAQDYYGTLNAAERSWLGVTEEILASMYEDYALAEAVYQDVISEVGTEVSDDEARVVTVQSILIRTSTVSPFGQRTEFTQEEKDAALQRARSIRREIDEGIANLTGVSFDEYVARYNEDSTGTRSFGRGETDAAFEETAFALSEGEISDVILTEDGYRIVKCLKSYDPDETQENKASILEKKQKAHFEEVYNSFAQELNFVLDKKEFAKIGLSENPEVQTDSFFTMYETYFH